LNIKDLPASEKSYISVGRGGFESEMGKGGKGLEDKKQKQVYTDCNAVLETEIIDTGIGIEKER